MVRVMCQVSGVQNKKNSQRLFFSPVVVTKQSLLTIMTLLCSFGVRNGVASLILNRERSNHL